MKISDYSVLQSSDSLLISQYKGSSNLRSYIDSFIAPLQTPFTALYETQQAANIKNATGDALDKIARIVGESRIVRGAAALKYFGFFEEASAEPFNVGMFYGYGDTSTGDLVLGDEQLRNLIRARIVKNTRGGHIEDILFYIQALLGREVDIHLTEGVAHVNIFIKEKLSAPDKLLLEIRTMSIISVGVSCSLQDLEGEIDLEVQ